MFKHIAITAAAALSAVGFGAQSAGATTPSGDGWAQEIGNCAEATGMTATDASAGGANVTVASSGRFVAAEVFAGAGSHVTEYLTCVIDAGVASGWLHLVVGQTSDADGMQAITFGSGVTILWSYSSDSNIMLVVATEEPITVS